MKKVISLVMAIALVMCLAIPTFAAQPDTVVPQACSHTWGAATTSTSWAKYNDSQCKKTVVVTRVCTKCAKVTQTSTVSYPYHGEALSRASCDGTTQTHVYNCPNFGAYRYTKWIACPGAGKNHKNGCQWLPI